MFSVKINANMTLDYMFICSTCPRNCRPMTFKRVNRNVCAIDSANRDRSRMSPSKSSVPTASNKYLRSIWHSGEPWTSLITIVGIVTVMICFMYSFRRGFLELSRTHNVLVRQLIDYHTGNGRNLLREITFADIITYVFFNPRCRPTHTNTLEWFQEYISQHRKACKCKHVFI